MLKKMVGEVTGLSDIGKIIPREEYGLVQADDYIFHEDNEIIHYVIKSLKDEYCFTNLGIIHIDGESAMSSKRLVKRYAYKYYDINNATIESAGKVDRDCEISFNIKNSSNTISMKIAVEKAQIEQLKDLYKALTAINDIQVEAHSKYNRNVTTITETMDLFKNHRHGDVTVNLLESVMNMVDARKEVAYKEYLIADFGYVFKKYMEN